jgi:hypothetical protein
MVELLLVEKSKKPTKKYDALFDIDGKLKRVSFGARKANGEPYSDFTQHKDEARKQRYLMRHRNKENWNNPTTPGALSRWILWNKPDFNESVYDFIKMFHL